ncbi:MAG TPA: YSC84-related protein [Gammaproteobacteria bacterium]|nr:YSC84-related protein [Gammaproteobacteria bacterium]
MNRTIISSKFPAGTAIAALLVLAMAWAAVMPVSAHAATAKEIDAKVNATLKEFKDQVKGAAGFLKDAKGVLVFPGVIKAGLVVGGEYGEGALRIHGRTQGYYSIAAASVGFQLGAQKKDIILVFLQQKALDNFMNSSGWKVGVDGSVALVDLGTGGSLDTMKLNKPIVGFVLGQKGLMYNLTLEGSKITKLDK